MEKIFSTATRWSGLGTRALFPDAQGRHWQWVYISVPYLIIHNIIISFCSCCWSNSASDNAPWWRTDHLVWHSTCMILWWLQFDQVMLSTSYYRTVSIHFQVFLYSMQKVSPNWKDQMGLLILGTKARQTISHQCSLPLRLAASTVITCIAFQTMTHPLWWL